MIESIKIFQRFQEYTKKASGPIPYNLNQKMDKILNQNPGWIIMERIARNLGGYSSAKEEIFI